MWIRIQKAKKHCIAIKVNEETGNDRINMELETIVRQLQKH